MLGRLVLAAAALLVLPAAASAQNADKPIAEVAADLAYGYCPLFLAGQFPLTGNPQLAAMGFGPTVQKRQDPRFGELQAVELERADGGVGFSGAVGKMCSVAVTGPQREAALAALRKSMSYTGLDFQPASNLTPVSPGLTLETFKADAGDQILYVQLIQMSAPATAVIAQLFVTDK